MTGDTINILPARIEDSIQSDKESDFKTLRENLILLINTSTSAINTFQQIATETQSPRAYEVLSDLLKTSLDANLQLAELYKRNKDLGDDGSSRKKVSNQAFFVGNTQELLDMIKQKNAKGLTHV